MSIKYKLIITVACFFLSGCASSPQLGLADVAGFNAEGKTIIVEYKLPAVNNSRVDKSTYLINNRISELHKVLKQYGFRPISSGSSSYKVRVLEGADVEITDSWKGAISSTLVIFTVGVVPAIFEYQNYFSYELLVGDKIIHRITTPAQWEKAVSLYSFSSESSEETGKKQSRLGAHDSVIRLWIDQGSFE